MDEERANGFSLQDSVSELVDNAFDANSPSIIFAVIKILSSFVLLIFDTGDGIKDLMTLYSCSDKIIKKSEGKRGLKNRGHRGAVGALRGNSVKYVSRSADSTHSSTLDIALHDMFSSIDRTKTSIDRNIGSVDASKFFKNNVEMGLTDKMRTFLTECKNCSTYPEVNEFLESILLNKLDHYFLMAVCYSEKPHESELSHVMNSFRRTYAKDLLSGKQLKLYTLDIKYQYCLTTESAVPFLGNKSPKLSVQIEMYLPKSSFTSDGVIIDSTTGLIMKITIEENKMWFNDQHWDGKRDRATYSSFMNRDDYQSVSPPVMLEIVGQSSEEEKECNVTENGNPIEESRGILFNYNGRALGVPIKNKKWGASRNWGGIRAELICNSQVFAEKFLNIQTKKNSMNFDVMHKLIQSFLNLFFNTTILKHWADEIIDEQTGVTIKNRNDPILEWDIPEICRVLTGKKGTKRTKFSKPATLTAPIDVLVAAHVSVPSIVVVATPVPILTVKPSVVATIPVSKPSVVATIPVSKPSVVATIPVSKPSVVATIPVSKPSVVSSAAPKPPIVIAAKPPVSVPVPDLIQSDSDDDSESSEIETLQVSSPIIPPFITSTNQYVHSHTRMTSKSSKDFCKDYKEFIKYLSDNLEKIDELSSYNTSPASSSAWRHMLKIREFVAKFDLTQ